MENVFVILNEQHKLNKFQIELLNKQFEKWEILPIPATGLNKKDIEDFSFKYEGDILVFASPIPLWLAIEANNRANDPIFTLFLFHNDKRDAKEVESNGVKKVIHVVAEDGWELLPI